VPLTRCRTLKVPAAASTPHSVREQREETVSKTLTRLKVRRRANGGADAADPGSEQTAENLKDLAMLETSRQEALGLGLDQHTDVKRAAQLQAQLAEKNDLGNALAAAVEVRALACPPPARSLTPARPLPQSLRSRSGSSRLGPLLTVADAERLHEAVTVAKQRGVAADAPQVLAALALENRTRTQIHIQTRLDEGLKNRDQVKVRCYVSRGRREAHGRWAAPRGPRAGRRAAPRQRPGAPRASPGAFRARDGGGGLTRVAGRGTRQVKRKKQGRTSTPHDRIWEVKKVRARAVRLPGVRTHSQRVVGAQLSEKDYEQLRAARLSLAASDGARALGSRVHAADLSTQSRSTSSTTPACARTWTTPRPSRRRASACGRASPCRAR
jgi:hypothetical protein